jgi:hypothetical protein
MGTPGFCHHLLKIQVAYAVPAISTDCPQDHITLKMVPLEVNMHSLLLLKMSV